MKGIIDLFNSFALFSLLFFHKFYAHLLVDKTKFERQGFLGGKSNEIKRKICKFCYYEMVVILSSSITMISE